MKRKRLTFSGTDAEILSALDAVRSSDKAAERSWKGGCVLLVLAFFLATWARIGWNTNAAWAEPAVFLTVAVLIWGVVKFRRGRAGDIDDARYELVEKLHTFLSCDAEAETNFHYEVDPRGFSDSAFFVSEQTFGSSLPRGKFVFYRMPLFSARYRLRDGTSLSLSIVRSVTEKTVTKYGLSGKVKTKTKYKYRDQHLVKIKLPENAPALPERLPANDFSQAPHYRASGPKATVSLWHKGAPSSGPDASVTLRLLCLLFFAIHQERQAAA